MTRRIISSSALFATVATASLVAPVAHERANAQALPVVDVCTGVSLPRSAVTEVIGAVNQPIVGEVEGTVNSITGLLAGIPLLSALGFPTLSVDLTTILADAAAGDPLSVQVLNSDGNIVTDSDDCNIVADNFTLDEEGGIAIGGNQISGLGTNGQAASAGEQTAIAFGNNASTAVGADGAIAFGTGASATQDNAVAIGAGSIADRAPLIGYNAFGITGTSDSAGAVSFGAPGQERQLINIAPGTADTDAATVGQVTGAIAQATGNLVAYDDATQASVTLGGAGGTTITNLADGALGAGSSDAVNGSQLFATNQNVTTNTTAISNLDGRVTVNEGDIANLQTSVTTNTTNIATNTTNIATNTNDIANIDARVTINEQSINDNSIAIQNLIDGSMGSTDLTVVNSRITQNENDIVDLDGRVTANEGDIANLQTDVATNTTNITAIDGRVSINEDNIASLDTRVTTNEGDIDNLEGRVTVNEGDIADLDVRVTTNEGDIDVLEGRVDNIPVGYVDDADGVTRSAVPTGTVAFGTPGGPAVRVTNVSDGTLAAGSTDAVNGGQLFATNQAVAQNRTDIDTNTANIASLANSIQGSTVAAVQYSDPDDPTVSNGGTITNDVTLVGANAAAPVALHNVADATFATDAVNLRQLQGGLDQVMADSMAYTDLRFADLSFDLSELENDAFAGTAAAMAMSAIPQTIDGGASMVGGAVSHYRGETAFGFGFSSAFNDGSAVVRVNGTIDTRGRGGVAAGAGFSF